MSVAQAPVTAPRRTDPLLAVRDLRVRVGGQELLTHVDFELEAGTCLSLVGESGSGKSLTCRAITGTMPRIGGEICGGSVVLDGDELVGVPEREWRRIRGRRVALVPQASLSSLDPVMTIGRQLAETIKRHDRGANVRERTLELLRQVALPNPELVAKSYPHELSGGMRQRVVIALAIAPRPTLLLADEPTTALDVTVQRGILELLRDLCKAQSISLVLVTHDLAVVESIADRVAIVYAGMTIEEGSVRDVFDNPRHPYTRALLAARPALDDGTRGRPARIAGSPPAPEDWAPGCRFAPRCPHATDVCAAQLPPAVAVGVKHRAACIRVEEIPR